MLVLYILAVIDASLLIYAYLFWSIILLCSLLVISGFDKPVYTLKFIKEYDYDDHHIIIVVYRFEIMTLFGGDTMTEKIINGVRTGFELSCLVNILNFVDFIKNVLKDYIYRSTKALIYNIKNRRVVRGRY